MTKKGRKQMNRSGKCHCQICDQQEFMEEHHIEGRDIPNAEHPSNKANICPNCHRKVHEGVIIIEGNFMTTQGYELLWHYKDEDGFTGEDKTPYIIPKSTTVP